LRPWALKSRQRGRRLPAVQARHFDAATDQIASSNVCPCGVPTSAVNWPTSAFNRRARHRLRMSACSILLWRKLGWRKCRVETARCQFAYRRRHSFRSASSHGPCQAASHFRGGWRALLFLACGFCQMLTLTAVVRACAQFANRRRSLRELRDARRPIHRHADVTRIVELCLQIRPGAV
jgi:hypothetical protein